MDVIVPPTDQELANTFIQKYGEVTHLNWSPALRWKFKYFNPDDVYETLLSKLVTERTTWLDIGCGRNIFPSNHKLSKLLSERAELLVGVDPDDTLNDNPYLHEKFLGTMEEFQDIRQFSLVTMRMVAEHVARPEQLMKSLTRVTAPNGLVLVYTVYKYSPVPMITNLVPFKLHNPVKKVLWGTEPADTFPTCFRMNTRTTLKTLFSNNHFTERLFLRLDDCRTFSGFKPLAYTELTIQRVLKRIGLHYPEYCLLGVFQKQ
jgi:2-polyprenyl-3-methyl-5-hydroxy-6-metoxy-1,4-benzoquinol methylase